MEPPKTVTPNRRGAGGDRQRGARQAALATLLILCGAIGIAAGPPLGQKPAESPRATPRETPRKAEPLRLQPREIRYLELGIEQLQRMEKKFGRLGPQFQQALGAGALASAALAAESRPDAAARRADAVRWTTGALDACAGRWPSGKCARTEIPLQKLALQYPGVLPAELLTRLRSEVAAAAPPPDAAAAADPWNFRETENQRMVTLARSLGAHAVAGTGNSPAARGWAEYAEAFLRAHDEQGWYEGESPGYMVLSITALLHLADHAPQPAVRSLAERQLNLLFAEWAQRQVGGYPAGPKSRTYSFWALSDRSTPWAAWAWMATGEGDPEGINFMDRPELPTSRWEIPASVVSLLTERRRQPPYEIKSRRRIALGKRKDLDTSLYSFATPDYILGAAQSVRGLSLAVSGGQEIVATLFPEGGKFAPLYLWSRTRNAQDDRWKSWMEQDRAVAHRNLVLARLGAGEAQGHAYLAPGWSPPEVLGDTLVSRFGDTWVALVTQGGWEVAAAQERFPDYYGKSRLLDGSWVAVPRRQPAEVALEVGRKAEHGDFEAWKKRAAAARLSRSPEGELRFAASDGTRLDFVPGERAAVAGKPLQAEAYPLLDGPFLSSPGAGRWNYNFRDVRYRFERLEPRPAP